MVAALAARLSLASAPAGYSAAASPAPLRGKPAPARRHSSVRERGARDVMSPSCEEQRWWQDPPEKKRNVRGGRGVSSSPGRWNAQPDAAAAAPPAAAPSSDGAVSAGARKRRLRTARGGALRTRVLTEARPGGMRVASGRPRDDYPALFSFLLGPLLSHLAVNWTGGGTLLLLVLVPPPHRLYTRS